MANKQKKKTVYRLVTPEEKEKQKQQRSTSAKSEQSVKKIVSNGSDESAKKEQTLPVIEKNKEKRVEVSSFQHAIVAAGNLYAGLMDKTEAGIKTAYKKGKSAFISSVDRSLDRMEKKHADSLRLPAEVMAVTEEIDEVKEATYIPVDSIIDADFRTAPKPQKAVPATAVNPAEAETKNEAAEKAASDISEAPETDASAVKEEVTDTVPAISDDTASFITGQTDEEIIEEHEDVNSVDESSDADITDQNEVSSDTEAEITEVTEEITKSETDDNAIPETVSEISEESGAEETVSEPEAEQTAASVAEEITVSETDDNAIPETASEVSEESAPEETVSEPEAEQKTGEEVSVSAADEEVVISEAEAVTDVSEAEASDENIQNEAEPEVAEEASLTADNMPEEAEEAKTSADLSPDALVSAAETAAVTSVEPVTEELSSDAENMQEASVPAAENRESDVKTGEPDESESKAESRPEPLFEELIAERTEEEKKSDTLSFNPEKLRDFTDDGMPYQVREVLEINLEPKYIAVMSDEKAQVNFFRRFYNPVSCMYEQAASNDHQSRRGAVRRLALKFFLSSVIGVYAVSRILNERPFGFARMTFTDGSWITARIVILGVVTQMLISMLQKLICRGEKGTYNKHLDIEAEASYFISLIMMAAGSLLMVNYWAAGVVFAVGLAAAVIMHVYAVELAYRSSRVQTLAAVILGSLIALALTAVYIRFLGDDIIRIVQSFVKF
ncbi:MAG: hypothetical protein K6D03_10685 [Solobacterium sp.]|nr:hypothetical protein [Solobacterium sp.]